MIIQRFDTIVLFIIIPIKPFWTETSHIQVTNGRGWSYVKNKVDGTGSLCKEVLEYHAQPFSEFVPTSF